jgi:hypothetical protein
MPYIPDETIPWEDYEEDPYNSRKNLLWEKSTKRPLNPDETIPWEEYGEYRN